MKLYEISCTVLLIFLSVAFFLGSVDYVYKEYYESDQDVKKEIEKKHSKKKRHRIHSQMKDAIPNDEPFL